MCYTPLGGEARRTLGPPGVVIFNAHSDPRSSSEVERRTQLLVENRMVTHPNIEKAWRHAGVGFPKGEPPFKVGLRISQSTMTVRLRTGLSGLRRAAPSTNTARKPLGEQPPN